jgi:hypothetical protein
MTTDGPAVDALHGFSAGARRALVLAEREARSLGHDRVGTEHVLLGLLADEDGAASAALRDAGAALPAARRKVAEAVGPATRVGDEPVAPSPRCTRAVGRAPRFARDQQSDVVGSEHLLLAVLDVEGTAGQVLRGLGVDVEHLRAALGARPSAPARSLVPDPPPAAPTCPTCHALVTDVTATVVPAHGHPDVDDVLLVSCQACGTVLGVA